MASLGNCKLDADDEFGPAVASCARALDFTLVFEHTILSIAPDALFILVATSRIWFLLRQPRRISKHGWLPITKAINACLLIVPQLGLLVLYSRGRLVASTEPIPAAVLEICATLCFLPLSYVEHYRSIRPSTILICYLLFSVLLDFPQARTLYLLPENGVLAGMYTAMVAVKATQLSLEIWSKKPLLETRYHALPTENTNSILSRALFFWMNKLFIRGFRKATSFEDLGAIDSELGSAAVHEKIHQEWLKLDHSARWPLVQCLWNALRWSALSPVPARLCYGGFVFAQPFLIHRATHYFAQPSANQDTGYGLIAATACIYIGIAISTALHKHQLYRHITLVRSGLVSIIYSESLSMKNNLEDPSAAVTLMSTDVDRVCQSLVVLHDLWSRPLELAVGITLLALQIGWISVMPLLVVVLSITADSKVTVAIGGKVGIWNDAVQQRISLTADVLTSMKSVKMLGLTKSMHTMLQSERLRELSFQAKFRHSTVYLNTLGNVPPALAAAITFIAFAIKSHVDGSGSLNASQAFTSLALISLVTTPATEILTAYPAAASCLGCLKRIEAHLVNAQRQQDRDQLELVVLANEHSDARGNSFEVKEISYSSVPTPVNLGCLLRNLDRVLKPQTCTLVVGPGGSGKSTLLKALHAELCLSDSGPSCARLAYCEQVPWLFTGTIRENICGPNPGPHDEAWYQSVLAACALRDELLALSHGDLTRIDAQAATLNFGQKQRIILARAFYQRPTLIFLDDVLSASGQLVEEVVMKELLGRDGLLRKLNAAAVVARTGRFNGIADNLITIDQQRNIQLCTNNPKLDDFIFSSDPRRYKYHGEIEGSNSSDDNCMSNQTIPGINPLQEVNRNDSDFGDYAFYFRSMTWTWVVLFFLFAATQTVCYYMSQIILQWWTADGGMNIAKWMPLYFAMASGNAVFFGVTVWTMFLKLVPESAAHLHRVLLDTVTNATYLFLASADVGVTLNRFSQDMTLIESQLPTGVLCTTIYLFWTIGSLALICTGSSWMALTVPAVLLALFFVQWVYLRTSRRLRVIELELRSPLYAHFLDTIKGLSAIRSLHWEQQFTGSMIRKLDDSQIPYYLLFCAQRWLQLVLDLIIAALAVIVMTLAVNLRGATNAGSLGLSLNNILSFNDILSFLLQYWTQLEVSLGSIARIRQFAKETPVERDSSAHGHLPQTWPTSGSIEVCDVSAGYGTSNEVFRHVTMSIRPGAKISLCGRTGSGKTSLLLLFLGLLEPSRGSVRIDGVDLRSIPLADIQAHILTIPQDTLLVQQKTVRFNVDPDGKCTDAQVLSAFSNVGLWPMLEKKGGLHAVVISEFLSASQRQLFGIARLLLVKDDRYKSVGDGKQKERSTGGVLLLDDATSKLDTATRIAIQRLFQEEFSGYTVITAVAADQLHTILDSDQIAVLDGGSLIDFGPAEELLAKDSVFRRMYEATEGTSFETMLRQPACYRI